jgi:hypothetical protein
MARVTKSAKSPKDNSNSGVARLREIAANCGAAALISILISSGTSYYFANKLENTKQDVAALVRLKDQVDESQNKIIAQLGIYGERLIKNYEPAKTEDLQSTILTAQLQINNIRDRMNAEDQPVLSEYQDQLGVLLRQVRSSPGPNDMVPVLNSVQKLLSIHEKFASRVRHNIEFRIF